MALLPAKSPNFSVAAPFDLLSWLAARAYLDVLFLARHHVRGGDREAVLSAHFHLLTTWLDARHNGCHSWNNPQTNGTYAWQIQEMSD